jgi:hypothetical protein
MPSSAVSMPTRRARMVNRRASMVALPSVLAANSKSLHARAVPSAPRCPWSTKPGPASPAPLKPTRRHVSQPRVPLVESTVEPTTKQMETTRQTETTTRPTGTGTTKQTETTKPQPLLPQPLLPQPLLPQPLLLTRSPSLSRTVKMPKHSTPNSHLSTPTRSAPTASRPALVAVSASASVANSKLPNARVAPSASLSRSSTRPVQASLAPPRPMLPPGLPRRVLTEVSRAKSRSRRTIAQHCGSLWISAAELVSCLNGD